MRTLIGVSCILIGLLAYYRAWKRKDAVIAICGAIFILIGAVWIVGWNGQLY